MPHVGEVTHHSIELTWEEDLERANYRLARAAAAAGKRPTGDARVKVELEQREDTGSWTSVYVLVRVVDMFLWISDYRLH